MNSYKKIPVLAIYGKRRIKKNRLRQLKSTLQKSFSWSGAKKWHFWMGEPIIKSRILPFLCAKSRAPKRVCANQDWPIFSQLPDQPNSLLCLTGHYSVPWHNRTRSSGDAMCVGRVPVSLSDAACVDYDTTCKFFAVSPVKSPSLFCNRTPPD